MSHSGAEESCVPFTEKSQCMLPLIPLRYFMVLFVWDATQMSTGGCPQRLLLRANGSQDNCFLLKSLSLLCMLLYGLFFALARVLCGQVGWSPPSLTLALWWHSEFSSICSSILCVCAFLKSFIQLEMSFASCINKQKTILEFLLAQKSNLE